ncbi:hypothetical protein VTI74DRAFT_1519 [Chaetomium olivicolor]
MSVYAAAIDTLLANFRSCFVELVLKIIGTNATACSGRVRMHALNGLQDDRHPIWKEAAYTEAKPWREWHWTQYDAWCRNNGHHRTDKLGKVDWNAKIV